MHERPRQSKLERYLGKRAGLDEITSKRLKNEIYRVLELLREAAGDDAAVNGAIRNLLFQPLHQVAEDLASIRKMSEREAGRLKPKLSDLPTTGRWLVTPNFGRLKGRTTKRIRAWYPKGSGRAPETLVELNPPWNGCEFMVWNQALDTFRAWPRRLYAPQKRDVHVPNEEFLKDLRSIELPKREHSTALLRLSLATGQRRVKEGWVDIGGGTPNSWTEGFGLGTAVPQSYAAACIQHLGPTFGVGTEDKGDNLIVTWHGAFVVRECIRPAEWLAGRDSVIGRGR